MWESSPAGPYDRWPSPGNGFEHFYGFLGGETDQWYPTLKEGTSRVEPWGTPQEGYHFTEDMTDKAIAWVRQQKELVPGKPFFLYYAPGATHAPHQVPREWADRYRGQFDQGWDVLREQTFARQKELGVIPADAELTRRHDVIPAWTDMDEALKPVLARQMETYAGFLEHTDHHVGRVIDAIGELGLLGDTLVYYIIGDNGASAEGTLQGTFNEMISLNGMSELETPEFLQSRLDVWGGPESAPHYAVGWAHAMCTPYQWTKQVASHWGGTRNGTIVHWPNGIAAKAEMRHQFHHLIDVGPTVLQAAGIPEPTLVNGVMQEPMEGVSMLYTFAAASAPERHQTQYFEMFGNRGIYHKGWSAVTKPELITGTTQVLLPGMGSLTELDVLNTRNRSWFLTAQLAIPDGGASGALLTLGGHVGGWSFYLKDGKPAFCYNLFGIDHTYIRADTSVPPGEHQVRIEFSYDGGGLGKGGTVTLRLDGDQVAEGRVEHTEPIGFGSHYTDVRRDSLPTVTDDYPPDGNAFTGTIKWLELQAGDDSHDHLIDPDHFIYVAMARQ